MSLQNMDDEEYMVDSSPPTSQFPDTFFHEDHSLNNNAMNFSPNNNQPTNQFYATPSFNTFVNNNNNNYGYEWDKIPTQQPQQQQQRYYTQPQQQYYTQQQQPQQQQYTQQQQQQQYTQQQQQQQQQYTQQQQQQQQQQQFTQQQLQQTQQPLSSQQELPSVLSTRIIHTPLLNEQAVDNSGASTDNEPEEEEVVEMNVNNQNLLKDATKNLYLSTSPWTMTRLEIETPQKKTINLEAMRKKMFANHGYFNATNKDMLVELIENMFNIEYSEDTAEDNNDEKFHFKRAAYVEKKLKIIANSMELMVKNGNVNNEGAVKKDNVPKEHPIYYNYIENTGLDERKLRYILWSEERIWRQLKKIDPEQSLTQSQEIALNKHLEKVKTRLFAQQKLDKSEKVDPNNLPNGVFATRDIEPLEVVLEFYGVVVEDDSEITEDYYQKIEDNVDKENDRDRILNIAIEKEKKKQGGHDINSSLLVEKDAILEPLRKNFKTATQDPDFKKYFLSKDLIVYPITEPPCVAMYVNDDIDLDTYRLYKNNKYIKELERNSMANRDEIEKLKKSLDARSSGSNVLSITYFAKHDCLPHVFFVAKHAIATKEEIFFDYSKMYWFGLQQSYELINQNMITGITRAETKLKMAAESIQKLQTKLQQYLNQSSKSEITKEFLLKQIEVLNNEMKSHKSITDFCIYDLKYAKERDTYIKSLTAKPQGHNNPVFALEFNANKKIATHTGDTEHHTKATKARAKPKIPSSSS
jgi:hypothetical protein